MLQKLIQAGNSKALIISKNILDSIPHKKGEEIYADVKLVPGRLQLLLDFEKGREKIEEIIDPEVYKTAKLLLKRYLPAFKALAKK